MLMLFYNDNWTVASLFDTEGNVVQFNTLVGGGETGLEIEEIAQEVTNGNYQSGDTARLMLASTEYAGEQQLRDWKFAKTPLQAVAVATGRDGGNLIWPAWTRLSEITNNPKSARSEGDSFMKCAFMGHDVNYRRVQNLLHGHSGLELIFPVAGVQLTYSANKGPSSSTVTFRALDFDSNELASVTESMGPGWTSLPPLTLPAGTYKVDVSESNSSRTLTVNGRTGLIEG